MPLRCSTAESSRRRCRRARARAGVLTLAAALALPAQPLVAQDTGPIFQLQPGLTTADFYSAPEDVASTTGFMVRFLTRFRTGRAWLNPVIGASFLPYGSTGTGIRNTDAPTLLAGNVVRLLDRRGSGWYSLELPILVAHSPGAGPTGNVRDYGRDVVVQPTLYVHLGERLFGSFGAAWSRLDLYAFLEQNLTPNLDPGRGTRDRINPVAAFGISLAAGGAK